jgi:hypothetical protein
MFVKTKLLSTASLKRFEAAVFRSGSTGRISLPANGGVPRFSLQFVVATSS